MARPSRLTDDDIHQFLWEHTNNRGKVNERIYNLAVELGISQPYMTERVKRLAAAGRVRKVKWDFWVVDPAEWKKNQSNDLA